MPDFSRESAHGGRVAGVDEVGRGPLAGPVVAAAVDDGRVSVIATVNSTGQEQGVHANDLLAAALPSVAGRGGGKRDTAQGGGSDPEGIPAAFAAVEAHVRAL